MMATLMNQKTQKLYTGLISPASGIADLAPRQDLLLGGQAGEGDLLTGCHLPVQADQGDVELHGGHGGVLEALVAVDASHVEAVLTGLRVGQVVFAKAHAPALQLVSVAGGGGGGGTVNGCCKQSQCTDSGSRGMSLIPQWELLCH